MTYYSFVGHSNEITTTTRVKKIKKKKGLCPTVSRMCLCVSVYGMVIKEINRKAKRILRCQQQCQRKRVALLQQLETTTIIAESFFRWSVLSCLLLAW